MFNLFFPATDLYEPLAVSEIDFAKEGQSYQIDFDNKYPGLHMLAIRVSNPPQILEEYEGSFILRLLLSKDGKNILSESIEGPGSPFWSDRSGFVIKHYRVPEELPLGEPLKAEITVIRADQGFEAKYGTSEIVVKKLSDE